MKPIKEYKNPSYIPSVEEKYMNQKQLNYFTEVLEKWRLQTQNNLTEVEERLSELNSSDEKDEMDRAFLETEVSLTINKISALQNLLQDIDSSLNDIQNNTYGFCLKTGKEIGLKRLIAKPTSRFAIKAQEDTEKVVKLKLQEDEETGQNKEESENE
jgi:DnaK suppressor protein